MLKFNFSIQHSLKSACLFHRIQPPEFRIHSIIFLSIAVVALSALAVPTATAKEVTVAWNANEEPYLEGYVVYRNTGSPGPPYKYSDKVPEEELVDPLHPKATLTGLKEGKEYYLALTAYNTDGVESDFSNDVCVKVVDGVVDLCCQSSEPAVSSDSSGGGGSSNLSCFITTVGTDASKFSIWIARPVIRSQVLAMLFLLLVLILTVKQGFSKSKKRNP